MDVLLYLADIGMWAVGLLLLACQMIAHHIGYRIGLRRRSHADGEADSVGIVVTGMLGLLAFVLGLTLSYSTSWFNERRMGTLEEANAIGTAWLRATAIDRSPEAADIAKLLEEYAAVRQQFVEAGRDAPKISEVNAKTANLQNEIWRQVTVVVQRRPDPIAAALMDAINSAFDASTAQRFALAIRFPERVIWLLVGIAMLSMGILGYLFGLKGRPVWLLATLLNVVWTALLVNILDVGSARIGSFRTDTTVYHWTRDGFHSAGEVP